jgi:shikimate dehydrogenase
MHNAAFNDLGITAHYEALDVAPQRLAEVLESFRQADVLGANVTIPYKLAVMPFMDELTDAAQAIGAVNTIIFKNGNLLGHNTDATGYLRALKEAAKFDPRGKKALILGAGGAARAIIYALLKEGVQSLSLYNRTQEKAERLAADFAHLGKLTVLTDLKSNLDIELLINTTSVGMEHGGIDPRTSPLPEGFLPKQGFVSDIVYRPAKTQLLRDADAAGLANQNGLPMLVYQGAESFERWTGQKPRVEVMFAAARQALGD